MNKHTKWLKYRKVSPNIFEISGIGVCRKKDIITPSMKAPGMWVTGVRHDAFADNTSIESIVISGGVTGIGADAFRNCKNLKKVVLPDTLQSIGEGAFAGCQSLVEINIPHSLKTVSKELFKDCVALEAIDLTNVREIQRDAFVNCTSLTKINMPSVPVDLSISDFANCGFFNLQSTWQGDVFSVDGYAFGCRKDEMLYIIKGNIKCILRGTFDAAKRYVRQPNPSYEFEMLEYERQMQAYEACLVCPNMPFSPPPEKEPQRYVDVPVPIKIAYEGSRVEWNDIFGFEDTEIYPFEVLAIDEYKVVDPMSDWYDKPPQNTIVRWQGHELKLMREIMDDKYGLIWRAYLDDMLVYIWNKTKVIDDQEIIDELDNRYGIPVWRRHILF